MISNDLVEYNSNDYLDQASKFEYISNKSNNFDYIINQDFNSSINIVNKLLSTRSHILLYILNELCSISKNTTSIIKFDIMQLGLFTKPIANKSCLTSTANRKIASIGDINAKTLEVNIIYQVINK